MKKKVLVYIAFMLIMIALGASDSMRGIFSGIFESHFTLTKSQVSLIVTISYIGNLVFILFGSRLADKYDKKKVCIAILSLWMASILLYICTDNYVCLLIGMFVSMGTSTLMNTMINILSPAFFGLSAGMIVNTLFFTQGIGTSANQNLTGRYAEGYGSFRLVNMILLALGLAGTLFLLFVKFPKEGNDGAAGATRECKGAQGSGDRETNQSTQNITQAILTNKAFWLFVLIFGFYFVAEHGIMNWWLMFLRETMLLPGASASTYLSLFFGGMTVGRLIFSPFISKLGPAKSIMLFGGVGTVLYVAGIFGGSATFALVSLSGLFVSIVYPTMVLLISRYFPYEIIASATGYIISAATLFDIAFNAAFGKIIDTIGFARGIFIFPVSMAVFYGLFLLLYKIKGGSHAGTSVGDQT